jgi:hypothetical protein
LGTDSSLFDDENVKERQESRGVVTFLKKYFLSQILFLFTLMGIQLYYKKERVRVYYLKETQPILEAFSFKCPKELNCPKVIRLRPKGLDIRKIISSRTVPKPKSSFIIPTKTSGLITRPK